VAHAVATDPDAFSASLDPVATGVRTQSLGERGFEARVYLAPFERLGLFTVRLQGAHVRRIPSGYAAITIPVSAPLEFFRGGQGSIFHPGSAHVLHTNDQLDLRIDRASGLFVATFGMQWIDHTASRLTEREHYYDLQEDWRLDLTKPPGQSFRHFLDFIWAETCRGGDFTRSELALREIENTCATLLILASEPAQQRVGSDRSSAPARKPLEIAEEYLRANLTEPFGLDKLIEITGASASTLLREFRKRHGMSPMQYLKLRRLEVVRRELLAAEPDTTTVTEIATAYGFYHQGRFAGRYRETFGELPSETLRRRG